MLRFGHSGSLSYSCETSRAARRRFAPRHGSTGTSATSTPIQAARAISPVAAASSWLAQARLPRAPILFAARPKERTSVDLLRLGSWFQRRARPTGVAILSWSYPRLPPKSPGKRSN